MAEEDVIGEMTNEISPAIIDQLRKGPQRDKMVSVSSAWILGVICMSSIEYTDSAGTTVVEQRKHIRSVQAKDVWPKFIYQSVPFNRNPSVHTLDSSSLDTENIAKGSS